MTRQYIEREYNAEYKKGREKNFFLRNWYEGDKCWFELAKITKGCSFTVKLKELLDAELKAKENGCHRGNYCRGCVHGIVVGNACYCTFGQCNNFQKDPNYDHNEFFVQGG